ncbi:MAG: ABC transporter ATP-binding protein [Lachnospiraceae bacterium]|nr:ABC transporter ATP-binding protein [Lachnospiraceae bacterium]
MMKTMPTNIFVKNIRKSYSKKAVLRDVNISFEEGKCIGIIGENGCGKTTLLSILSGLVPYESGEFIYGDTDLLKNDAKRQEIVGYIPQGEPLVEELSAMDNLLMWYEKDAIEKSLKYGVLGMLGIGMFIDIPVKKMSGGMKKRLSIGCGVHHNPKLLILDEPTAALDMSCREKIYSYLKDYRNSGNTIIMVTHEVREIELCDEIYILKNGEAFKYTYDGNVTHLVGQLK